MSMPSESEQTELSQWDDEQRHMRITDKIKKMLSEAEQRILQENVAPIQEKVFEHDDKISKHDGVISRVLRAFSGVVKG